MGATGPPGANGVSGYEVLHGTASVGNGTVSQGTIDCPAGKKPVGGGWDAGAFVAVPSTSSPTSDGAGWTGALSNNTGGTITITFYVVCITAPTSSAAVARVDQGVLRHHRLVLKIVSKKLR